MCGNTPENGPLFGRVYTGPKPGVTDERRRSAGFDCKFSFSPFPPFLACRTVTEVAFCRPPPPCRPSVSNPPRREVAARAFAPPGGPDPGLRPIGPPPAPLAPSRGNPPAREVAVPDFGPAGGPEPGVLSNRSSLVAKCRAIGSHKAEKRASRGSPLPGTLSRLSSKNHFGKLAPTPHTAHRDCARCRCRWCPLRWHAHRGRR